MKKLTVVKNKNSIPRARVKFIRSLFFFICIVLIGNLFYLQIINGKFYRDKAIEYRFRSINIEAKRGFIYDREGNILALSGSADSIYAEPQKIKTPEAYAKLIAPVLGVEEDKILKQLSKKAQFVYLARKISDEKSAEISRLVYDEKKLINNGIGIQKETKRYYPKGDLAAQILGFTDIDGNGLEGIEYYLNEDLKGRYGLIQAERDRKGDLVIEGTVSKNIPKNDGNDIYLTIDSTIQLIAEKELAAAASRSKIKSGCIIVLKPENGEILAMANYPNYDPNNFTAYSTEQRKNIAVSANYEPGSTFKIVIAAAALEEQVVHLKDTFLCKGVYWIGKDRVRCHTPGGHGRIDFVRVVEESCNPSFVDLGLNRLGVHKLYKYLDLFGFGKKTGIDMPGEELGIVRKEKDCIPIDVATMSIGQGIAVTPIQVAIATAAVANGGYLLKPQLIKEIRDSETNRIISSNKTEIKQKIISSSTAETMRKILQKVVEEGTGSLAALPDYTVAGKTGTAQKVDPKGGYMKGKYVASFVGFAPANNPKAVILVVLDEPSGLYYGGQVAAPVFLNVMQATLKTMGIKPDKLITNVTKSTKTDQKKLIPDVIGETTASAIKLLNENKIFYSLYGNGKNIEKIFPAAGEYIEKDRKVSLITNKYESMELSAEGVIPDLTGKSKREVESILYSLDYGFIPHGNGSAVSQQPKAGTRLKKEENVTVYFQ